MPRAQALVDRADHAEEGVVGGGRGVRGTAQLGHGRHAHLGGGLAERAGDPDHERVDLGELLPRTAHEAAVVELLDRPDGGVGREQELGRGDDAEDGGGGAHRGRDPGGRAGEHGDRGEHEHECRDRERDDEQPPGAGGEHERLGLRPAEQCGGPSPCEHDAAGDHPLTPPASRRRRRAAVRAARPPGMPRAASRSTRAPRRSHPDPQASGLVVLELEQMKHEMEPPGDQDEQAKRGGDEPDGRHPFAASRGCSRRKRRATARNWPGESA